MSQKKFTEQKKTKGKPKPPKVTKNKCPYCGSSDVYPVRGNKGAHWWSCDSCGAEY
jgi:transcription elongation factor Elf1